MNLACGCVAVLWVGAVGLAAGRDKDKEPAQAITLRYRGTRGRWLCYLQDSAHVGFEAENGGVFKAKDAQSQRQVAFLTQSQPDKNGMMKVRFSPPSLLEPPPSKEELAKLSPGKAEHFRWNPPHVWNRFNMDLARDLDEWEVSNRGVLKGCKEKNGQLVPPKGQALLGPEWPLPLLLPKRPLTSGAEWHVTVPRHKFGSPLYGVELQMSLTCAHRVTAVKTIKGHTFGEIEFSYTAEIPDVVRRDQRPDTPTCYIRIEQKSFRGRGRAVFGVDLGYFTEWSDTSLSETVITRFSDNELKKQLGQAKRIKDVTWRNVALMCPAPEVRNK